MFKLLNGIVPVFNEICGIRTEIVCPIGTDKLNGYQEQFAIGKIYIKGDLVMVDVEKIKLEIERLKALSAEEYCADTVAKIYADFEASRSAKIRDLEVALEIFDTYQVVEEVENAEENAETEEVNE